MIWKHIVLGFCLASNVETYQQVISMAHNEPKIAENTSFHTIFVGFINKYHLFHNIFEKKIVYVP